MKEYEDKKKIALAILGELRLSKHKTSHIGLLSFDYKSDKGQLRFKHDGNIFWTGRWHVYKYDSYFSSFQSVPSFTFPFKEGNILKKFYREIEHDDREKHLAAAKEREEQAAKDTLALMGFDLKDPQ